MLFNTDQNVLRAVTAIVKKFLYGVRKKMLFIWDHTKFYRPKLNLTLTKLKSLLTLVINMRPSRTLEAHFKHRAPEHSFYSFMAFDNLGWVAVAISTDKQQHQFPESQLSPSGLQLCASVCILAEAEPLHQSSNSSALASQKVVFPAGYQQL